MDHNNIINWLIGVSACISMVATCFIAYYANASNKLTHEIRNQDKNFRENLEALTKKHQKELSDLYQAIVIATLIGDNIYDDKIKPLIDKFNTYYNGSIEIFKGKK